MEIPINLNEDVNPKNSIGYLSIHVPEELIIAAGKLPYRILGNGIPVKKANAFLPKTFDPHVLDSLEGLLDGKYSFIDGIIVANVSDAHRRLYDVCKISIKSAKPLFLDVPKGADLPRQKSFKFALKTLIKEIENAFGVKLTDTKLKDAIKLCNETRSLLKQISNMRKSSNQICSGEMFFNITKWSQTHDKQIVNKKLSDYIDKLKESLASKKQKNNHKPRIMIMGSVIGSPDIFSIIENCGVNIVCDDICVGNQYFAELIDETSPDVIDAIAKRYISIPTARMVDTEARWEYLLKLANDYEVDGVIYFALKFDDIYLFEYPHIKNKFRSEGYPLLFVEAENFLSTPGQIETRVQAFVEMLG